MPNPYVTIPAMPRWAQQAWLQQYLATRNAPPTPSTGELIGTGVLGALDQGLGAVTKNWQLQAGLDQQMALESMRESAATDRQQALFDQQTALAEAQRRAAALKAAQEGIASGAFLSRYNTPELTPVAPGTQDIPYSPDRAERGGAMPPTRFSDESLRAAEAQNVSADSLGATPFPVAPSEMSGYRVGTAATAEIPRPPLSRHRSAIDALTSLGAFGTMVPGDMVTRAQEDEKMRREKQPASLSPEQQYQTRAMAGLATEADHAMALRLGWQKAVVPPDDKTFDSFDKMATEDKLRLVVSADASSPLVNSPLVQSLGGLAAAQRLAAAALAGDEASKIKVFSAEAIMRDSSERGRKADIGKGQLTSITTALDIIEPMIPQLLLPGASGRIAGGIKGTINDWLQIYPELNKLKSLSIGTIGPTVRQINQEVGTLAEGDVNRGIEAFGVRPTDSLEVGLVKARALRMFTNAANASWDVYRTTTFATPVEELNRRLNTVREQQLAAIKLAESADQPQPITGATGQEYNIGGTVWKSVGTTPEGEVIVEDAQGNRRKVRRK